MHKVPIENGVYKKGGNTTERKQFVCVKVMLRFPYITWNLQRVALHSSEHAVHANFQEFYTYIWM
jgi:hypothetical protein